MSLISSIVGLIALYTVLWLSYTNSYAHGVVYDTAMLPNNKLKITLKWSDPNEKKGLSIAYYHLKNGKTLTIGYETKGTNKSASMEYILSGAIPPIRIVLSNISSLEELPFSDIKYTEAEEYIRHLHDSQIINGKSGDIFKPKDLLTRAEFMVILTKSLNVNTNDVSTKINKFSDIDKHWAKSYILKAIEIGLASGYKDGTFKPDNKITLAEVCTAINNAFNLKTNYNGIYNKLKIDKWYSDDVKKIFDLKILLTSDSIYRNFNEENYINRANCAMMVSRALTTYKIE